MKLKNTDNNNKKINENENLKTLNMMIAGKHFAIPRQQTN